MWIGEIIWSSERSGEGRLDLEECEYQIENWSSEIIRCGDLE